jgi:hypothetical protein
MQQHELQDDLNVLSKQLSTLKAEMDTAIGSGKSFAEVKAIHAQIKALSRLITELKDKNSKNALQAAN